MEITGAGNPLVDLDVQALLAMNGPWPGGDLLMWWVSQTWIWLPLYALLLWMLRSRLGNWKKWGWSLSILALSLVGTDMASARIAKPLVERPRPSHEPALEADLHLVVPPGGSEAYRGGTYGFFSSHAANHMGIAVVVGGLLGGGWALWSLIVWAMVIGYSRIYLGVHYPGDVLAGALWGAAWGWVCLALWSRMFPAKNRQAA